MRTTFLLGVGAGVLLAACGGGNKNATGGATTGMGTSMSGERPEDLNVPQIDPTRCDASGADKRVAAYDLNHDDKPDAWKIFKSKDERGTKIEVMTCKQVDLDHDAQSRKDYVVLFDDQGTMVTEEFDFDFDGRFDARRHYDKNSGKRTLVERNTDFDDKPDLWEEFDTSERVERVLRDRNADSRPDYWELYNSGTLEAILYDEDFDGKVDKREDSATATPPSDAPTPPAAAMEGT